MPKFENPASYTGRKSNQKRTGQARFATQAEAEALVADDLMISPKTLSQAIDDVVPDASTTVKGKVELATAAEMSTGTDAAKVPAVDVISDYIDGLIQVATVTVSSAELLALATTPKELVAAPAAGSFIQFLGASFILNYNSVQYTEAGDNMGIKYENASGVQVSDTIECTGFIDAAADTITNAVPVKDAIVAASGSVAKALVLDNLGSNFAAGNSPMDVQIIYRVLASGL